jgi:diadenylate cyclase
MDMQAVTSFFSIAKESFLSMGFTDILDILLLSVIIFGIYQFLRDRRASNLASGVIVLVLGWLIARLLNMYAISSLLRSIFDVGVIAIIVVFQSEIRTALEKVGDRPWRSLRTLGESKDLEASLSLIDAICEACSIMSKRDPDSGEYTGALIVIERTTKLGDIMESGVELDAKPSATVFHGIFYKGAPMHDGAVIVRNRRIAAAGCMLPLTSDNDIDQELGSRHRAALGMSEASDALIVVVSEQTGIISVASDGTLTREYSIMGLRNVLKDKLIGRRDIEFGGNS